MKKFRLLIAALVVLALLSVSLTVYLTANDPVDPQAFLDNWETKSGRYLEGSGQLIENSDTGFTYEGTADGGIYVKALPGDGVVPTSVVTSKNTTALDGLSVTIQPEEMEFTRDTAGRSEVISVMWTVDPIQGLDVVGHFDHTATNGIRNIAQPTKGLGVIINNSYDDYNGTATASNVYVILIDGNFIDTVDNRLGYRWSFSARNFLSQSPNSDGTEIVQSYEAVDISNGLTVSVRADAVHGYIVSVNDKDYYSAEEIAYYPNDIKNQYDGASMTARQADIDLTPLADAGEGYVSVSVSGTLDTTLGYSYTITEINGTDAAAWAGDAE